MSKQKSKVKTENTPNFLSSKAQKDAIYEIYRSCRLCGTGTGYRMPIVQNIAPVGDAEVELKTKIQECLQIEVHEADKMPPLICELCADKICDFYDFLVMCQQTNKQTRIKLGIPMSIMRKELFDTTEHYGKAENKEIGKGKVSEKRFINKAKDVKENKIEIKKEVDKIKKETRAEKELRLLIASNPIFSVSHRSRQNRTREDREAPKRPSLRSDNKFDKLETKKESRSRPGPASSKLKRLKEIVPNDISKKIKIEEPRSKRSSNVKLTDNSSTSDMQTCDICKIQFPKGTSFNNHNRIHKKVETSAIKQETSKAEPNIVGKCRKCGKAFEVYRTFIKHQAACRGGRVKIPRSLRRSMKPAQVRMIRCDSLLSQDEYGHYDVSDVRCPYGLDRSCLYPYNSNNSLLSCNRMVDIKFSEIPDAFDINEDFEEYVHWDSDESEESREVESLSKLSIKVIFSEKFLGKVPKKRKKVKPFYDDFSLNIDRIICNLSDTNDSKSIFDNIKDNWSDNVSDSILKDNNSDTFSFIGELNDDSCSIKSNDKINDCDGKSNDVEKNRLNKRSSPIDSICMLELNKNALPIKTSTNDIIENSDPLSNKITNTDSLNNQKCSSVNVSEHTSERNNDCNDKFSFEEINSNVENLNTLKSEIEVVEIQILNDNDEENGCNKDTVINEPTDSIFKDVILSETEESSAIPKTCETLSDSSFNETVPQSRSDEASRPTDNTSFETIPQTEKTEVNENNFKENNENIGENTDTNDENEIIDSYTNNTNLNVSFDTMDTSNGTPNIAYNKEIINLNIEPETTSLDSLSIPKFNINGNVQNEAQNMTDFRSTTKTVLQVNSMDTDLDIYNDLIGNNILNNVSTEHKTEITNGDLGLNSDLEDISDDEMDDDKLENANILDDLMQDKSMDLDNVSDGEFALDD